MLYLQTRITINKNSSLNMYGGSGRLSDQIPYLILLMMFLAFLNHVHPMQEMHLSVHICTILLGMLMLTGGVRGKSRIQKTTFISFAFLVFAFYFAHRSG